MHKYETLIGNTATKLCRQSALSDLFCITVAEYSARGIQTTHYLLDMKIKSWVQDQKLMLFDLLTKTEENTEPNDRFTGNT